MLQLELEQTEYYDEIRDEFIVRKAQTLQLEHSLVSLSKWESTWEKPFLDHKAKTYEQTIDYIRCMTITSNADPLIYTGLSSEVVKKVTKYIDAKMTATTFSDDKMPVKKGEIVTAELIYYWLIALQIPFECQKWHLNRLITLIKICNIKNAPPKKMRKRDIMARNRSLNDARRAALGTTG